MRVELSRTAAQANPNGRRGGMAESTVTMERSPGLNDAEVKARLSRVYTLLLNVAQRAEEMTSADDGNPGPEAPSAASSGDASRCQLECTIESARAQVAEG